MHAGYISLTSLSVFFCCSLNPISSMLSRNSSPLAFLRTHSTRMCERDCTERTNAPKSTFNASASGHHRTVEAPTKSARDREGRVPFALHFLPSSPAALAYFAFEICPTLISSTAILQNSERATDRENRRWQRIDTRDPVPSATPRISSVPLLFVSSLCFLTICLQRWQQFPILNDFFA
jgi:hypothetical protein